jgi:transposase
MWFSSAPQELQPVLQAMLVARSLVLYALTSTWLSGRCCCLAAQGHSRDGKSDDPQIVFGLVCTAEGCPISVEVFEDNTADPATVTAQLSKLKERFGIERVAWAGDRGMLTSARIEQVLEPQGMDCVSSLRAPRIAQLAEERARKRLELLAATEADLAKIAKATQRARARCAASRPSPCAWAA